MEKNIAWNAIQSNELELDPEYNIFLKSIVNKKFKKSKVKKQKKQKKTKHSVHEISDEDFDIVAEMNNLMFDMVELIAEIIRVFL